MKDSFFNEHIKQTYVSFIKKCDICGDLVQKSTHETQGQIEVIKINSPIRHLFLSLRLVEAYTDIEIDFNNAISEYDALTEYNLISIILAYIPKYEIDEFKTVFDMYLDDMYQNEYSLEAMVYNLLKKGDLITSTMNDAFKEIEEENKGENDG